MKETDTYYIQIFQISFFNEEINEKLTFIISFVIQQMNYP